MGQTICELKATFALKEVAALEPGEPHPSRCVLWDAALMMVERGAPEGKR